MLILSRRLNESIVISDDIVVTVLEVRGDQVRLGIRAPRHVTVHREEVQREIMEANKAAAKAAGRAASGLPKLPRPERSD
ncbi:MAG TPA: carbon storage regulator CsrA [Microthrixaceae bacterium]|nr:carbon storage regulator CsrA [Microthrixaceae bacterium]